MRHIFIFFLLFAAVLYAAEDVPIWSMYEASFTSQKSYDNPLYEVESFRVTFTSPNGRTKSVSGFWDGGNTWKVRFTPDETGGWTWTSECSDGENAGLHEQTGAFECVKNKSDLDLYQHGSITHPAGEYYFTHADGTPFFWTACTAWNGALLSTEDEWEKYLTHRKNHGYNVIQFVTTQWRGCEANRFGEKAFEGSGRIRLNVDFFKRMDKKIQRINDYGLIAAPVLLWALPFGDGMELSPGYYLPVREAVLIARYMVARFGGYQVIWILGGDGKYVDEFEQRWKNIGWGVFGDEHPGLVTLHPMGRSWVGDAYADEDWYDFVGYQSSHSSGKGTVEWITKGPMTSKWDKLPPRPFVNMEPNYEEIGFRITAEDVRNACYWSIFATPVAGITYGANGIWPWLHEGERILNHYDSGGVTPWNEAIDFPGSIQIGYLAEFVRQQQWWRFKPAPEYLVEQPGNKTYNHFISVVKTEGCEQFMAYTPKQQTIKLYNQQHLDYEGEWFDTADNKIEPAVVKQINGQIHCTPPREGDFVLVLNAE